jgi:hypothetical protein
MRLGGKGKSMSDVEKEIDELQCKLTAKTREIEAANLRRGTDREMAAGGR